jgi:hypothetical protein
MITVHLRSYVFYMIKTLRGHVEVMRERELRENHSKEGRALHLEMSARKKIRKDDMDNAKRPTNEELENFKAKHCKEGIRNRIQKDRADCARLSSVARQRNVKDKRRKNYSKQRCQGMKANQQPYLRTSSRNF